MRTFAVDASCWNLLLSFAKGIRILYSIHIIYAKKMRGRQWEKLQVYEARCKVYEARNHKGHVTKIVDDGGAGEREGKKRRSLDAPFCFLQNIAVA